MSNHHIFAVFLDENRQLKLETLNKLNFVSKISIENFGYDELNYLYKKFKLLKKQIIIYHAVWKGNETFKISYSFQESVNIMSEISYEDKIYYIPSIKLYVWAPSHGYFFVIFGEKKNIFDLTPSFLTKKHFMEVLDDDTGLSEQGRRYMLNALETYGRDNV